jgi:long-chain acyl-CoA synthetase
MGLYDFTFYHLICRNAVSFKGCDALLEAEGGLGLNFEQYKMQVDRVAAGLQSAGVAKATGFGVLAKNSLNYFTFSEPPQPGRDHGARKLEACPRRKSPSS